MADELFLSKIKLGDNVYNLKDAKARQDLETLLGSHALAALGNAAWLGVDASLADGGTGVATSGVIKSYVDSQVGAINKFDVKIYEADSEGKPNVAASAQTMYILGLVQDAKAEAGTYVEFITVRSGVEGSYTYAWEKIGSTKTDLTDYLTVNATVAGVAFGADKAISAAELEAADALNLKALSHKDSASQTLNDYATGITGASYTPAGSVSVKLDQTSTAATLTKADYTPAGFITGSAISGGSINVTVKDAESAVSAAITAESYTPAGDVSIAADAVNGTQITGSVSKPDVDVTPADATFVQSLKAGNVDAASYSHSGFSGGSLGAATKSQFAIEGMVAAIDGTDAEQLNLTVATKADAVTAQGAFTPAEYGTDNFSAEKLPVVDGTAKALTGVTAALHAAPVFTGDKFAASFSGTAAANMKVTDVKYFKQEIDAKTFTPVAAELGFSGTTATDALVTGVNYNAASIATGDDAPKFTGTAATITPTLDKGSKTITVE